MSGLPPGLTYDEWVGLWLNEPLVRWLRIDDAVQAARIAARPADAPLAYYRALLGDEAAASRAYADARLAAMMAASRR